MLDNALSLITLLSLFLLGPALGRALVACVPGWQDWSLPIQHLVVGICTMIAVTGMILALELETQSQEWIERAFGFGKGLETRRFDIESHRPDDPLFPYAAGNVNVTGAVGRPPALESESREVIKGPEKVENKRPRR